MFERINNHKMKDQYRTETNKDVYETHLMEQRTECFTDEYVLWLENMIKKLKQSENIVLADVSKLFTAKQIVELLEEEETLDDAKMFFVLQQ